MLDKLFYESKVNMDNLELLSSKNKEYFSKELKRVTDALIDWKVDSSQVHVPQNEDDFISIEDIPKEGNLLHDSVNKIMQTLNKNINFSSKKFMGFPDSGNSMAGLLAAIVEVFLQQNLINKEICSPFGTRVEANVISWLRQIVGYSYVQQVTDVTQLGGAVTTGGVMSNTYALMADKKKYPQKNIVILPDNIGHYSLSYATEWLNLGVKVIYCKTVNYRLSISHLEKLLKKYNQKILFIGVYACDSMTSTCENLKDIYESVKHANLDLWLHCDACHGFVLGFSEKYKNKIEYLKYFDSCTMDPHKVLWLPYTLSVVLMKDANDFSRLSRGNSLIMDDPLSFGQTTPFIGSKSYDSLKLWMVINTLGTKKIGKMVNKRISNAQCFYQLLSEDEMFSVDNNEILFSVIFQYLPSKNMTVQEKNLLNRKIYKVMSEEGKYYFHGFEINVDGVKKFVLRYNSGNLAIQEEDLKMAKDYIKKLGNKIYEGR